MYKESLSIFKGFPNVYVSFPPIFFFFWLVPLFFFKRIPTAQIKCAGYSRASINDVFITVIFFFFKAQEEFQGHILWVTLK